MYAIIDIGSNTIRLKVYKYNNNQLEAIVDKKEFAKLINYRKDGNMSEEGILICIDVLNKMLNIIKLLRIKKYYAIATAPFRGIKNSEDVLKKIKEATMLDVSILKGEDEAYYSYLGAKASTLINEGALIDIGGGSTELVFFKDSKELNKTSIPCGSLNMQGEFYKDLEGFAFETKWIRKNVIEHLKEKNIEPNQKNDLVMVGVGGTIRALLKLKRNETGSNDITISYDDIKRWYQILKHNPIKWLKEILLIVPERVYTMTTGLIILKTVMKYIGANSIIVSEYGVREGYLTHILENKEQE